MHITEANFLTMAKQKDERALEYIMSQYGWVMKTVVDKHLYHLSASKEECINDTFLGIWQHIHRYDPDKSSFPNWVAGLALSKALPYVRQDIQGVGNNSVHIGAIRGKDQSILPT